MTNPLSTQTVTTLPIEETYSVAESKLPNGKILKQLVQRVINEKGEEDWQLVDEKLRAFDDQFKDTETIPGTWRVPTTATLTKTNRETESTVAQGGVTRIDMRRALILSLGDPQAIIQQRGLDADRVARFKRDPAFLSTLYMMAKKHGGEWSEAAKYLNPSFPDSLT